jgi:hypothetical protein
MIRIRSAARALAALGLALVLALALAFVVGALATAHAAPAGSPAAHDPVDFQWHGVIASGHTLEINGINTSVRAAAGGGRETEVTATKQARRSDPAEVRIEVSPHDGDLTLCVIYPNKQGKPAGTCGPDGYHQNDVRNNDVVVDFDLKVPAGVRIVTHTVNGSIEGYALDNEIDARTVNGSVHLSTARSALAASVNGSITASLGLAGWSAPLEFKTVNGSVTVDVPRGVGADFHAETVNGEVTTDFPVTVSGRLGRHHIQGTIGGGGRELRLATVNGNIHLAAARRD